MRDNTRLKRYALLHTCRTPIQLRKSLVLIFISIYLVPIHVQLIRAVIWRTMNFNCRLSTCIHYIKFGLELCQQYFCFPLLTLSQKQCKLLTYKENNCRHISKKKSKENIRACNIFKRFLFDVCHYSCTLKSEVYFIVFDSCFKKLSDLNKEVNKELQIFNI